MSNANNAADTTPLSEARLEVAREHLRVALEHLDAHKTSEPTQTTARLRFAEEYEASAAVLRRRARGTNRSPEQVAEELRRADWLEKRATVLRAGGRMPAELRTPTETFARIDELRRAVLRVTTELAEFSFEDIVAFTRLLTDDAGEERTTISAGSTTASLVEFATQLNAIVRLLGGRQRTKREPVTFLRYEVPGFEVGRSVVVSRTTPR